MSIYNETRDMAPIMYRIAWIMSATKFSSHGEYCLTYELAKSWLEYANNKYPEINHYIEHDKS
jgi:hypothetical protein